MAGELAATFVAIALVLTGIGLSAFGGWLAGVGVFAVVCGLALAALPFGDGPDPRP